VPLRLLRICRSLSEREALKGLSARLITVQIRCLRLIMRMMPGSLGVIVGIEVKR
jgi:hypothetical protein